MAVATELLINLDFDTAEPSAPVRVSRVPRSRVALRARLRSCRTGRTLLAGARWAVAMMLVIAGYFAAAGISAGVQLACRSDSPSTTAHPVLASAQK